jgi:hypothetical protein
MDTRRNVLKKMAAGSVAAGLMPATVSSALEAAAPGEASGAEARATLQSEGVLSGAAPWWLIAPLGMGSPLKYGWYVAGLSSVERGAAVLTLAHTNGRRANVHVCGHGGRPRGVAHADLVDLVLMDGGSGSFRTDEKLGRVLLGLAERVRRNESGEQADLRHVARMMPHDLRVAVFGAESLVG